MIVVDVVVILIHRLIHIYIFTLGERTVDIVIASTIYLYIYEFITLRYGLLDGTLHDIRILKRFPIDVFDYYAEDVYARVFANVYVCECVVNKFE